MTVPAGVDSDSNIRLRELGDAGKHGGPRGHLYCVIKVWLLAPVDTTRVDIANCPV